MKRFVKFVITCALFNASCTDENLAYSVKNAAAEVNANSYSAGIGSSIETGVGTNKYLRVKFSEFNQMDQFESEQLSSVGALAFYNNLDQNNLKKYTKVKVLIERGSSNTETMYNFSSLDKIDNYLSIIEPYVESINSNSYPKFFSLIDTNIIDSNITKDAFKALLKVDSLHGEIIDFENNGFKFAISEDKTPLVTLWYNLQYSDSTSSYLKLIADTETKKIVYINIY